MISAPITAAAIAHELLKHRHELFDGAIGMGQLLTAGFGAFAFGMLAIGGLIRLLRHFGYLSFAVYRVVLAFAIFKYL
jgi:undecaprenyl pyrophosphate phosphatase UppP